jgi:hypothetical protein
MDNHHNHNLVPSIHPTKPFANNYNYNLVLHNMVHHNMVLVLDMMAQDMVTILMLDMEHHYVLELELHQYNI